MLCKLCKQDFNEEQFSPQERTYKRHECRSCKKLRHADYYKRNHRKVRTATTQDHRSRLERILDHYGAICACCGEKNKKFLTVDHINNDGVFQRKLYRNTYSYVLRSNFPKDIQILCYNCNLGKARNKGVCPHQEG